MSALPYRTLVFRGHDTTDDPTTAGYFEARVQVVEALAMPKPVEGGGLVYIGDVTDATEGRKLEIKVAPIGFETEAVSTASLSQDWGELLWLDYVLRRQYVYLWRTYQTGSDASGGPIQRAGMHQTTVNGSNYFWHAAATTSDGYPSSPAGFLPLAVELSDGGISPTLTSGGTYDAAFTLVSRDVFEFTWPVT